MAMMVKAINSSMTKPYFTYGLKNKSEYNNTRWIIHRCPTDVKPKALKDDK